MGTLTVHLDLPYISHGNSRTAVCYTYRASKKFNKSQADTYRTNKHSRDPSISARFIVNPGIPDTINNDSVRGFRGKRTKK